MGAQQATPSSGASTGTPSSGSSYGGITSSPFTGFGGTNGTSMANAGVSAGIGGSGFIPPQQQFQPAASTAIDSPYNSFPAPQPQVMPRPFLGMGNDMRGLGAYGKGIGGLPANGMNPVQQQQIMQQMEQARSKALATQQQSMTQQQTDAGYVHPWQRQYFGG